MSGRSATVVRGGAVEVAPLSHRVAAMAAFRLAAVAVLGTVAAAHSAVTAADVRFAAVYLALTGGLSLTVFLPRTTVAVKAFGISLLIDGLFLTCAHERLGHRASADVVIAAALVAVCLLASFRTGLKLALWQSLLVLVAWRGQETGLLPAQGGSAAGPREITAATDLVLLWLVVITTSVAAAINERELRRRRYDAEALERLATALLADDRAEAVAERLVSFLTSELGVQHAVLTGRSGPDGTGSALLDLAAAQSGATLALRLDPLRDAGLTRALPRAARLAAVPLGIAAPSGEAMFLVLAFGSATWRNARVERRVLAAATQAAATAAIALSRAQLLDQTRREAVTDGLTGLANRRAFEAALGTCEQGWREQGRPYALIMIDVDRFKSVNDLHGHQIGDEVLSGVAVVLAELAPMGQPRAVVARYGGEEFAVILPGSDTAMAATLAERLRIGVRESRQAVPITISLGVAGVPEDADAQTVVRVADDALRLAKESGRDRVMVAGPALAGGASATDVPAGQGLASG